MRGYFDRQSSEPIFLTSSSKGESPLGFGLEKFSSARQGITPKPDTHASSRRFKVQRSHKRVKPVFDNGVRLRIYDVEPSDRVHLFHGLPFQKYNQSLVRMFEFQRMIVINELKLLLDKAKSLKAKLNEVHPTQALDLALFDLVDEKIQQSFNAIFEETIGLVFKVSEILMEFCEAKVKELLPFREPVTSETEAFFGNIRLFAKEVDRLAQAQDWYIRATKRKRVKTHVNIMEPHQINLLMQYLARARFNVGEVHEEFTFQEAHQNQQTKWLCRMATMSSLQDFLPTEVKQLVRGESANNLPADKTPLTREEVKDRVKTGYKKGSLARNMGLAVLHTHGKDSMTKRPSTNPEQQTNSDFIQKLLSKFTTSPKTAWKGDMAAMPPTELVSIERYKSQASELDDMLNYKNFAGMLALRNVKSQPATSKADRHVKKSDRSIIRALHTGLLVSSDEKRFSAIRSIILEHEQIQRNRDERLRIEKELLS